MNKRIIAMLSFFVAGIFVGLNWSTLTNAQLASLPTKQILKTDLQNLPGQEVLVFTSDWPPGFRLPLHIHPEGHEFAFVIEGEQTFEVAGSGTKIVKAGEVLYTPPNVHAYPLRTGAIVSH